MHKLRGDSTRGGSPRSGHESHLISTMYIYSGSANSYWGRRMGGGQRGCSRGCGWVGTIGPHGWGPRCVPMGKRMGWTRIIVCNGAYVITSVQTRLICCLTCFLYGVVVHKCVASTRCGHECGTLTRLTASTPLTSTCLPTTPYCRFTCVARIACIVQGQLTNLFNRLQGINTIGVDLRPWFALPHNPQL